MGNKTPSTASCESMCVDILLPEENDFNKIQLDLKFQSVELRSPKYILILPLPHPINPRVRLTHNYTIEVRKLISYKNSCYEYVLRILFNYALFYKDKCANCFGS